MWADLLTDGGLEAWNSSSVLTNWTYYQGGTGGSLAREATIKLYGTYSAKITKSNATYSLIQQDLSAVPYRNKAVVAGVWVKSANTSTGSGKGVRFIMFTSGLAQISIAQQTNTTDWQYLLTSLTVGAAVDHLSFQLNVQTDATDVAYFDQVKCIVSPIKQLWSVPTTQIAKINGAAVSGMSKWDGIAGTG
jgi:hypothetical protein